MTSGDGASSRRESALSRAARRFFSRDAWVSGRRFYERAAARDGTNAHALAHLGFFCVKESRYDTRRGLSLYKKALRLDPSCVIAHLYRGVTLGYMLKAGPARRAIERARKLGAIEDELAWALGCVELDAGSVTRAILHFKRLAKLRGDLTSLILVSQAYSQAGRNGEALRWAHAAGKCDSKDFRAPLYAGIYLAYLGRFSEARRALARAERLNRLSPLLQHSFAYVARAEGDLREEERRLKRALKADPDYVTSRKGLGDVCVRAGRVDAARAHYEKALKLFPDYREAREAVRRLGR